MAAPTSSATCSRCDGTCPDDLGLSAAVRARWRACSFFSRRCLPALPMERAYGASRRRGGRATPTPWLPTLAPATGPLASTTRNRSLSEPSRRPVSLPCPSRARRQRHRPRHLRDPAPARAQRHHAPLRLFPQENAPVVVADDAGDASDELGVHQPQEPPLCTTAWVLVPARAGTSRGRSSRVQGWFQFCVVNLAAVDVTPGPRAA